MHDLTWPSVDGALKWRYAYSCLSALSFPSPLGLFSLQLSPQLLWVIKSRLIRCLLIKLQLSGGGLPRPNSLCSSHTRGIRIQRTSGSFKLFLHQQNAHRLLLLFFFPLLFLSDFYSHTVSPWFVLLRPSFSFSVASRGTVGETVIFLCLPAFTHKHPL